MMRPHHKSSLWLGFLLHRLSGLILALFLPAHFYVLGLALVDTAALDGYLILTRNPVVKFMECTLVFLLAVHLFGGLRVLALEFLPWHSRQKTLVAASSAAALFLACLFLLRAF